MNSFCPVCNSSNTGFVQHYRANNKLFENMDIVQCNKCSVHYASPAPEQKKIDEFNNSYFSTAHGGVSSEKITQAFFSAISKLRYHYIQDYIKSNNLNINKILEIGPGLGYLAIHWKKQNPAADYFVVETDVSCHDKLIQNDIQVLADNGLENLSNDFDMVIMSHVLEHVSNPREFLNTYLKKLKKGGVLFIEVPCNDWMHKNIDEPHLLFFSKKSLEYLLKNEQLSEIQLNYYGKSINELARENRVSQIWQKIRFKLINLGLIIPFAALQDEIYSYLEPIEKAAIKPHKAYIESKDQAWWLRALSIK